MNGKLLRPPPAYNTCASDVLARVEFYGLSGGERGLLGTMERVYWVARAVDEAGE